MTEEQKALFRAYEDYKREIAELEEKCDAIKPQLLTLVPEGAKIDTGTGIFSTSSRKKWTYTEETTLMEKELKEKMKEEEQLGLATADDGTPFIVFKAKKE
jgi:hypothetical protein